MYVNININKRMIILYSLDSLSKTATYGTATKALDVSGYF